MLSCRRSPSQSPTAGPAQPLVSPSGSPCCRAAGSSFTPFTLLNGVPPPPACTAGQVTKADRAHSSTGEPAISSASDHDATQSAGDIRTLESPAACSSNEPLTPQAVVARTGTSSEAAALLSEVSPSPPPPTSTLVDRLFGGRLCSSILCSSCGHRSSSFEPFLDVSLPIPTATNSSGRPTTAGRQLENADTAAAGRAGHSKGGGRRQASASRRLPPGVFDSTVISMPASATNAFDGSGDEGLEETEAAGGDKKLPKKLKPKVSLSCRYRIPFPHRIATTSGECSVCRLFLDTGQLHSRHFG